MHLPAVTPRAGFPGGHFGTIIGTFAACCANVTLFEAIVPRFPVSTALTLAQSLFILVAINVYALVQRHELLPTTLPSRSHLWPLLCQNIAALLTNRALDYGVGMSTTILLRSTGTAITMVLGYVWYRKRYSPWQLVGALAIALGTAAFTLQAKHQSIMSNDPNFGVALLLGATTLSSIASLQRETLTQLSPPWLESLNLSALYGFVIYLPMANRVWIELKDLGQVPPLVLCANLVTQLVCVSSVQMLALSVSALTLNIVLLCRRVLSIAISASDQGFSQNESIAILTVVFGALLYFVGSSKGQPPVLKQKAL